MNNNPLKQYFRRPAVYLKLPSGGKFYAPGVVNIPPNGELPVYPMTAIDEITIKTPDALYNGSAIVELIKSCVPDIKDPWVIPGNDLDAILIAIKTATGDGMNLSSTCPKCENVGEYSLNLPGILASLKPGNYSAELEINDLKIKFRPLTYKEMNEAALAQFEINRTGAMVQSDIPEEEKTKILENALRRITDQTMIILAKTIEYIKTPSGIVDNKDYILDFLKNCDRNIYIALRDYSSKIRSDSELPPLDIKCVNCSNEYSQAYTLNLSDFFG
jgi:hypothetical protein